MECFKLDKKEIYDLSDLTKEERSVIRKHLYNLEKNSIWKEDDDYIYKSNILYYGNLTKEWLMLIHENKDIVPTKNAKELFCSTEQTTIKKHSYSWEDREELRNKWFKRKNSQEESMVRHIQNKMNVTTWEFELHINGIHIEQFEKEFEWIG